MKIDDFRLQEQLGIDAKAVKIIRVAQYQKEYNKRYDTLVIYYEETKHKCDAVTEQTMIRSRKIEQFTESVL